MKVDDILNAKGREVETIGPQTSVAIAVDRLSALRIGALVVSADGRAVMGTIAERDIVRGLARHGARLLDLEVGEVMSRNIPVCSPEDTVGAVMTQMTRTRNRHVPVVRDGQLQGLVSIGDVVKHRLEELEVQTNVLRAPYITRH